MIKGSCFVGQSGGPTSVINASLVGVITACRQSQQINKVYGAFNGVEGILKENFIDLSSIPDEELALLKLTPGAALGSVRHYLENFERVETADHDYHQLLAIFKKYNIRYFFYIGGNDSMDTCHKIATFLEKSDYEAYVIGIPKTIDNDLMITDHTPGYGSAIKYIATTISQIYLDINSYEEGRVTIVEIMGRDAGWLTAGAKLASLSHCDPDFIYLPEIAFDLEHFLNSVEKTYAKKKKVLIVVGEGIKTKEQEYLLKYRHFNRQDVFGHLQLGGVAQVLCEIVNEKLSLPVRSIELNLPQRSSSIILSKTDVEEAYMAGYKAVDFALEGHNNQMVVFIRSNEQYHITYGLTSLKDVSLAIKSFPLEFLTKEQNQINQKYIDYALPLIQGEISVPFENGLPKVYMLSKK